MGYKNKVLIFDFSKFKLRNIGQKLQALRSSSNWRYFVTSQPIVRDNIDQTVEQPTPLKFKDIPAARRLPFIGTKLDFLLAGSGRK